MLVKAQPSEPPADRVNEEEDAATEKVSVLPGRQSEREADSGSGG